LTQRVARLGPAIAILTGMLVLAACGPAAAPAAPPPPSKPVPGAASGAASPAPGAAAAAQPAAAPAWQAEWERTLAAARQEGRVVVVGPPAALYRDALVEFEKAYPGIALDFSGLSGRDFAPKVLAERRADQYLVDVHVGGAETVNLQLKPEGAFEPIKPALILPEVLDDSKWLGGFDEGFMDREKQFTYGFQGTLSQHVWVNRELIPESELNAVEQLADPKWRGKIAWNDPRAAGGGSAVAGYWLALQGEDWLRQVMEQDVAITRDLRQQVEWVVRGRYPIAVGGDDTFLIEFQRQGLGQRVETLALHSPLGGRQGPAFGNAMLMNRAPHPNAAKVYLNWLLSKEGQATWTRATDRNSRRLDVKGSDRAAPVPGVNYLIINREENQPHIQRAMDLADTVFR
jgi:iron(III) transport system substrate-binding protein